MTLLFRSGLFLFSVLVLCSTVLGQNNDGVFSIRGTLDPDELKIIENADVEEFLAGLDTSFVGLNVTVVANMCGVDGFRGAGSCEYTDSEGFEAGVSLLCGPQGGDISSEYVVSNIAGGTQSLILTKDGLFSTDSSMLTCIINAKSYNSGPIEYEFSIQGVETLPTLVVEQQAALDAVYRACCSDEGSCSPWRVDTNGRKKRRSLLQADAPAPEPIVVDANDTAALNPAAEPAEEPAAEPLPAAEPAPAPSPVEEPLVPGENTTLSNGVYTDFCKVSGNQCTADGLLTTLDVSSYGLRCDVAVLTSLLKDIPTLENLDISENPGLTGPLDKALDELALAKTSGNDTLAEYRWLNIHVDNTSISGTFSSGVENATSSVCSLIEGGLEQLSLEKTGVSGPLEPCMFASDGSTLQIFEASETKISSLPSTFPEAPSLRSFKVRNASLSGTVDGLPPFLAEFQVSENNLTGGLPSSQDATVLYDVSGNMFDGEIPEAFVDHPVLRSVSFSQNQLSGIPANWMSTTWRPENNGPLKYVYFSSNPLGGGFPAGLAFYENVTGVYASSTEMTGPLPELADGAFPALLELEIQENDISGTVPDSWEGTKLFEKTSESQRFGNFSTNAMSGSLPSWLGGEILNASYDFSGNQFSNGCEEQFDSLQACSASSNATAPTAEAPTAEAPAPSDDGTKGSEEDSGGSSTGLIVATVIVCLIILGFGGYYVLKKYRARRNEGTFTRFEDSGVQMTSNQAYTTYSPSLDP